MSAKIRWLCVALVLGCSSSPQHGTITPLSVASSQDWKACQHQVPEDVCVRCHPERAAQYKQRNDWCPEHDVPESQCLECHPDLDFSPPRRPPENADVRVIVEDGEDLAALEPHLVSGKFTIFGKFTGTDGDAEIETDVNNNEPRFLIGASTTFPWE